MNSFIQTLGNRVSSPRLVEPAPNRQTLTELFQASLRVPDHLQLRPWRFLVIEGEKRKKLGQLFAEVEKLNKPESSDEDLEKIAAKAMRAPLIIVGVCNFQENHKVPEIEQQLSTGCVLHNLGLGLRSLGFASIWRTGRFAFDKQIMKGLGLTNNESIIGYLYVGTSDGKEKKLKTIELEQHVQYWD